MREPGEPQFFERPESKPETEPESVSAFESKVQKKNFLMSLRGETEMRKGWSIKRMASERNVSPEDLKEELRVYAKEFISYPERTKHYHTTSLENITNIAKEGSLLSRTKLREKNPDVELPPGSASEDLMMTRDLFKESGELRGLGLDAKSVGASGRGVTFVFGKEIMDRDDYDAIGIYPTVSEAPLKETCEVMLVEDKETSQQVREILEKNGVLNMRVALVDEWREERIEELSKQNEGENK